MGCIFCYIKVTCYKKKKKGFVFKSKFNSFGLKITIVCFRFHNLNEFYIYKIRFLFQDTSLKRTGACAQLNLGKWVRGWWPEFRRYKVVPGFYWHTRGKNLPCVQECCIAEVSNVSSDTRVMHVTLQLIIITPYIFLCLAEPFWELRFHGEQCKQLSPCRRRSWARGGSSASSSSSCSAQDRTPDCVPGECLPRTYTPWSHSLNAWFISVAVVCAPEYRISEPAYHVQSLTTLLWSFWIFFSLP